MNYFIHSIMAAGVAWISFVSVLRADSPVSIEIVGVTLAYKNQITVEFEEKNISDKNINIGDVGVRLAAPSGEFYVDPLDSGMSGRAYVPVITIYADLTTVHPDGTVTSFCGNWGGNMHMGGYPPPPMVLKPGEKKSVPVVINMDWLLQRSFLTTLAKDVWVRVGLFQSGGQPTVEETQELMRQSKLLPREEYEKVKDKLLSKYSPIEVTHGNLYKLELPKDGEALMRLVPIKPPF